VAARDAYLRFNRIDNSYARRLLEEAISIDPNYTGAIVLHGMTYWWDARFNKSVAVEHSLRFAEEDSEKSLALNSDLGIAYMLRGGIAWLRDDHDQAIKYCEQAVELSPSDAHSIAFLGMLHMYAGEYEKSIATLNLAMRLCPQYPPYFTYYLAFNEMWTSNFPKAIELMQLYQRQEPDEPFAYAVMATILAFHGRKTDAAQTIGKLRERFPNFGMTEIRMSQHYRDPANMEKVVSALSEAGLPD
jgi:tetratricopeptide (TPR) repeat protein